MTAPSVVKSAVPEGGTDPAGAALTSFDGFRREWNLRWPDFALDWGEPERPCGADFDPWSACERESV